MSNFTPVSTFEFAGRPVRRLGYGAMQLAGPGVFGPPKDHDAAIAVLREAVASGVNHIDTSDFYGPHITNQIIREALHPYQDDLVIVTKLGAVRGDDVRIMGNIHSPAEGSIEKQVTALAELQREGLVRHIGLSNVTAAQIVEAQGIATIVCVQNHYNLVHREDDTLVDELASQGIAYVPFFPLGGFTPIQSSVLSTVAQTIGTTPMQVALTWLLHRSPNILLIPGTSSLAHLRENLQAGQLNLSDAVLAELDAIGQADGGH